MRVWFQTGTPPNGLFFVSLKHTWLARKLKPHFRDISHLARFPVVGQQMSPGTHSSWIHFPVLKVTKGTTLSKSTENSWLRAIWVTGMHWT